MTDWAAARHVRRHGPAASRRPRPRTGVPGRRQLLQLRSDSRHRTQLAFAFWGTDFLTRRASSTRSADGISCATQGPTRTSRSSATTRWTPTTPRPWPLTPGREHALGRPRPPGDGGISSDPAVQSARPAAGVRPLANAQMHILLGPLLDQFWVRQPIAGSDDARFCASQINAATTATDE
jgi:hypothetical protein